MKKFQNFKSAEKIQNFLCERISELFWSQLLALVIITSISVGIQSLLFWLGGLAQAAESIGMWLDIFIFGMLVIAAIPMLDSNDLFPNKDKTTKGIIYISLVWLFVLSAYVNVIVAYLPWVLALSILIFVFSGIMLENMDADLGLLFIPVGIVLIYCIGTYFAMCINGLRPAIDTLGISGLSLLTASIWMYPAFKHSK